MIAGIPVDGIRANQHHVTWSAPSSIQLPRLLPVPNNSFDDWIHTLPLWERQLLLNLHFLPNQPHLHYLIESNIPIHLASDGGADADANLGSFGFVIADHSGPIIECHGPATGYPMQSFRAECYGRLAQLLFLVRYTEY